MKNEACSFCSREAEYGPFDGMSVCDRCARLVAEIARAGDREIWSRNDEGATENASSASFDESLVQFKERIAALLPEQDADSHANLAEAYRAMGLYDEAVAAAAAALHSGRKAAGIVWALQMLLSPPLLKLNGLGRLKSRLRP